MTLRLAFSFVAFCAVIAPSLLRRGCYSPSALTSAA